MPELNLLKDWAITAGGIIALITFLSGLVEYVRRGRQDRAQNFIQMRRRFLETPQYREILDLLQAKDSRLREVSIQEKRNFVGFLEEVALMTNSGLIKREISHYMFGYYVLLAAHSDDFWVGLDRDSQYWSVFRCFAREMESLQGVGSTDARELSF